MVSFLLLSMLIFLYFSNKSSFLNSLVILESVSLLIFFNLVLLGHFLTSLIFLVVFLVFIICESSIGLSILVDSVKFYMKNSFSSLNFSMF